MAQLQPHRSSSADSKGEGEGQKMGRGGMEDRVMCRRQGEGG